MGGNEWCEIICIYIRTYVCTVYRTYVQLLPVQYIRTYSVPYICTTVTCTVHTYAQCTVRMYNCYLYIRTLIRSIQWNFIITNIRGDLEFFLISEIHYNQFHFHSRTLTGSHEFIHCIQKFTVRDSISQ